MNGNDWLPNVSICSHWGPSTNDVMLDQSGGMFPFPFAEKRYPRIHHSLGVR